jgi:hypothetical protein
MNELNQTRANPKTPAAVSQRIRRDRVKWVFMGAQSGDKSDTGQELHHFFRRKAFLLAKMKKPLAFGKMWAPEENECHSLILQARPQASPRASPLLML